MKRTTAEIITIPSSRRRLVCAQCGVSAASSCDCGVAYVPAGERAAAAVAANPQMSDRAIAADLGVSYETVRRKRGKSTVTNVTVRVGRDGKKRHKPKPADIAVVGGEPMSAVQAKQIARKLSEIETLSMRRQINAFIGELTGFENEFVARLKAWREANPDIEPDGRDALVQFLVNFSMRFQMLAQKIDQP